GTAFSFAVASTNGVTFRAIGGLPFAVNGGGCNSMATYTDFHFDAHPQSLSGSATGTAMISSGDDIASLPAQFDFTGVPDATGPRIEGILDPRDPFDPGLFMVSEPLPARATAHLESPTEQIPLTASTGVGSIAVVLFHESSMLRYDTTYRIAVDPWIDLAGNPGAAP